LIFQAKQLAEEDEKEEMKRKLRELENTVKSFNNVFEFCTCLAHL
jgi:hypothetical protein